LHTDTDNGMSEQAQNEQHPQFEKRALQLAAVFKIDGATFDELPDEFTIFCQFIGYNRVCSLLIISDLGKGRSERQLATKYGLTRAQIEGIKKNSRLCRRRQE